MIILLIFFENSVSIIKEKYFLFILFTFFDYVTLVMFRFLWNISFYFNNFSIVFFCFFAFTFWILISCIMISYAFFRIFIESSITLVHCVWFFNFFLIFENAKNSIKFSLKSHFNFIVSLLLFSMILLIFFKSSTFVMFRNSFFSTSFSIFIVNFFFFFVAVVFVVVIFFIAFFFSFSILVIFVAAFTTLAYVFALIDYRGEFLAFCWLLSCRRWAKSFLHSICSSVCFLSMCSRFI